MNDTGVDDYMDAQDKRIAELEAENERLGEIINRKDKLIDKDRDYIETLQPLDDEIDGFTCLAEGHHHRNRYQEALCSARFQIATCQGMLDNSIRDEQAAENERLRKRLDASRYYSISLQRAIEYHCKKKTIPEGIFRECPYHAAMLAQHAAIKGE